MVLLRNSRRCYVEKHRKIQSVICVNRSRSTVLLRHRGSGSLYTSSNAQPQARRQGTKALDSFKYSRLSLFSKCMQVTSELVSSINCFKIDQGLLVVLAIDVAAVHLRNVLLLLEVERAKVVSTFVSRTCAALHSTALAATVGPADTIGDRDRRAATERAESAAAV